MMSNPLPTPSREQVERGVAVVTAEDNRWQRCDLKTISLLGNVLMRQLAADAGAVETVMFRDGFLTEASASNVLIVDGGHDRRAAEGQPDPAGHHLRRDARSSRATPACRSTCGRCAKAEALARRRDVAVVVDEGSARDHDASTASRSAAASRARCSAGCTRCSSREAASARDAACPGPARARRGRDASGSLLEPGLLSSAAARRAVAAVMEHEPDAVARARSARPRR